MEIIYINIADEFLKQRSFCSDELKNAEEFGFRMCFFNFLSKIRYHK